MEPWERRPARNGPSASDQESSHKWRCSVTRGKKTVELGASRRDFLRVSAAGTVALGLAQGLYAQGSDMIRIGLVGCGIRGTEATAQSLAAGPDVRLVAMSDVFEDRVQDSLAKLRLEAPDQVMVDDDHCFSGLEGYKHVIESADVVLIACASKFHPMYSEAAIQAGKHVFVEKPHGIDPPGVRRSAAVCELAKQKGLSILSGLQSRFHAGWQEAVSRIHEGIIGDVVAVQSMFLRAPYRLQPRRPETTEIEFQFRNWYHFCWLSGDDLPQSLVHNLDRVSWILKEELPQWAFGLAGRSASFGEIYGDMFDHHTAVFEYASGPRVYALSRTQEGCYRNSSDIIMGTKGTCYLTRSRPRIEGESNWQYSGEENNPFATEQKVLIEAVRKGKPINSGAYMANSTMLTVMGQIACYTGVRTDWDAVYRANLRYGPTAEEASMGMKPPTLPDETGNYPLPRPGFTKLI